MNNKEKKTHSMKARGMISDVIVHVVLALLAIVWVIPVLWIALLSFSTQKGSYVTSFFPKGYTLHNYVRLFLRIRRFWTFRRCLRIRLSLLCSAV